MTCRLTPVSPVLPRVPCQVELRQLRYFVAVAQARHFGHAARLLRIAPPSLSQQIRALERDLGVLLLVRDPHGVALTPAGRVLLEHARALLGRAETAREQVRHATAGRVRLTVRATPGALVVLGPALGELGRVAPEVDVDTATCPDSDALHAVRHERADLALVWGGPGVAEPGRTVVARVPVVVLLPAHHRSGPGAVVVAVRDVAAEPVLLPARAAAPELWEELLAAVGGHRDRVRYVPDPTGDGPAALQRAVAAGHGIAPLPEPLAALDPTTATTPVPRSLDPPAEVALHAAAREPVAPAVRRLVAHLTGGHGAASGRVTPDRPG
jgi:DNA-binding transcriptional LysR family regulator